MNDFRDLSSPPLPEKTPEDVEREARNDARLQARAFVYDLFRSFALAMEPLEEDDE